MIYETIYLQFSYNKYTFTCFLSWFSNYIINFKLFTMTTNEIIAKNIKRVRKEKGLSQQELADKMGVKRAQISFWETNGTFTISTIDKIVEVLEIKLTDLI